MGLFTRAPWRNVKTVLGVRISESLVVPVIIEYVKMGRKKEAIGWYIEDKYRKHLRSDEVEWALTEAKMVVES